VTEQRDVVVLRWPDQASSAEDGLAALLTAYHLATEAEKGVAVTDASRLPDRYREEILDPGTAFAGDVVLVALIGDTVVGCLVVTAPAGGRAEIKRLWTDPANRGRGIASRLLDAGLTQASESGVGRVRLSVWEWRTGAVALYERFGFMVTDSWDERDQLVCMERAV
jgi:ribosomal protein S18 acetylase RimI-like enzyme